MHAFLLGFHLILNIHIYELNYITMIGLEAITPYIREEVSFLHAS